MDDDESMTSRTIGDDLYEPPLKRTTALTRKTTTTNKEHQDQSTAIPTSSIKRTAAGVPVNSRVTSNASTVIYCLVFRTKKEKRKLSFNLLIF